MFHVRYNNYYLIMKYKINTLADGYHSFINKDTWFDNCKTYFIQNF